jgi:hypothetical protein
MRNLVFQLGCDVETKTGSETEFDYNLESLSDLNFEPGYLTEWGVYPTV